MKKTQLKDAQRNIRKQFVSFLSIVVIAAMAVMAYLGLNFASHAIANNADSFYETTGFRDAEVISTLLLTGEDLETLRGTEGVADVEAVWLTSGTAVNGGQKKNAAVLSLTERINTPLLESGRLPETADECVVEHEIAEALSLTEGDTVRIEGASYLSRDTFTVCGITRNGDHATNELNTPGDRNITVLPEAFDLASLDGCCMKAYLRYVDTGELNRFEEAYFERTKATTERIEAVSGSRTEERTAEVRTEYGTRIADGETELADAKQELDDARKTLDDGWAELADGESQAEEAKSKLEAAKRRLESAARQLSSGKKQLADGALQLADAKLQLEDALAELTDGQTELDEAKAVLDDGRKQLDDGWAAYYENETKLTDAKAQLEEAKQTLDDGETQYESAGKQLEDAEREIAYGRSTVRSARSQLVNGYDEIEGGKATVRTALYNTMTDALGAAIVDQLDWTADTSTVNVDSAAASATDFPITEDIALDLNLTLAGNIASVLTQLTNRGVTEAQLEAAVTAVYGVIDLLPGESFISGAARKIAETYATYDAQYETLATAARTWDAGHTQYIDGKNELYWGEIEYDEGVAKYEAARKELDDGWAQYNGGLAEYEDGAAQLAEGLATLNEKEEEYAAGLAEYEAGATKLADGWTEYNNGLAQYNDAKAEYDAKSAEYAAGRKEYESGLAEYRSGEEAYAAALETLESGRAELEEGEKRYADGLAEYRSGERTLNDAKETLENLDQCRWVILDMKGNASYQVLDGAIKNVSDLGMTFALIFILVGALVIYATLGRIVEEQRRLVGATRALGLYKREILTKYMIFGIGATLIGMVLGAILGYAAIQPILTSSYGRFYTFDNSRNAFLPGLALIVLGGGTVLSAVAVWSACSELMRSTATSLMQEKAPPAKQSGGRFGKLSLYARLILLNIRTDKKRVAVTIISVAGCCALLVAGFTMRNGVMQSLERQYGSVVRYDYQAVFSAETAAEAIPEAEDALEKAGAKSIPVFTKNQTIGINGALNAGVLICGDLEEMQDYFTRLDPKTRTPLPAGPDGVWICVKVAEVNGLAPGDSIILYDGTMRPYEVPIAGIFEEYTGRDLVMSRETYTSVFGKEPEDNALMVRNGDAENAAVGAILASANGIERVDSSVEKIAELHSLAAVLDLIALLMIGIAAVMACFILLNLISMHVNQKKRELTIMRVNGFTVREVIAYIARETVVTNLIGIVLGVGAGLFLGYRTVCLLEGNSAHFVHDIQPMAILLAVLITAGFSIILNAIALRKVKYLKLTDVA